MSWIELEQCSKHTHQRADNRVSNWQRCRFDIGIMNLFRISIFEFIPTNLSLKAGHHSQSQKIAMEPVVAGQLGMKRRR
jgi:hypothetical protein